MLTNCQLLVQKMVNWVVCGQLIKSSLGLGLFLPMLIKFYFQLLGILYMIKIVTNNNLLNFLSFEVYYYEYYYVGT